MDQLSENIKAIANSVGIKIRAEFEEAERDRRTYEQRWIEDLRAYKGIYDPEIESSFDPNQSRAFVRMTRKKVKAIDARLGDMLFPVGKEKNWSISATPEPEIEPGSIDAIVRELEKHLQREATEEEVVSAIKKTTENAANRMATIINDQLVEAKYSTVARQVIHSGNLYGTGILKGPLVELSNRKTWIKSENAWRINAVETLKPSIEFRDNWFIYPDMSASCIEDCRYVFDRHVMPKHKVVELAKRSDFDGDAIRQYLREMPEGDTQYKTFETELKAIGETEAIQNRSRYRYELLERWGILSGQDLVDCGCGEIEEDGLFTDYWTNIWTLGPVVIKVSIEPIQGVKSIFHFYYYDKDETSIWGEGAARILRSDQTLINAGTRNMLDHAAISGGVQMEVNADLLDPTEISTARDVRPRRVWLRRGQGIDAQQRALHVFTIPNHIPHYLTLIDKFEKNAHEATVPSYMHGENDKGVGRTVGGLSMLMGSANIEIKDQVKSYDDGITKPFITALYHWNMNFNDREDIKGDFEVYATGASSLVAKELRAQQLEGISRATLNPFDAPFVKRRTLLEKLFEALDIDDEVLYSEDEINQIEVLVKAMVEQRLAQQGAPLGQA